MKTRMAVGRCCCAIEPVVAVVQWGSWYSTGLFRGAGNPGGGEIGFTRAAGVTTERRSAFIEISAFNVPRYATITTAIVDNFLSSTSGNIGWSSGAKIQAHDADNSALFGTYAEVTTAPRTSAFVDWYPIPGSSFGTIIDSPDITSVLQEIVDRPGWNIGNRIAIFFEEHNSTGTGSDGIANVQFPGGGANAGTLAVTFV